MLQILADIIFFIVFVELFIVLTWHLVTLLRDMTKARKTIATDSGLLDDTLKRPIVKRDTSA